jgi:carboxylesterase type B
MPGPDRDRYRAFHSSELPYVFDNLRGSNRPWEPLDVAHAETMSSYWTNFVTGGDPNGSGRAPWPAFRGTDLVTMELGARIGRRPVADAARVEFFTKYFAQPPAGRPAPAGNDQ